MNRKLFVSFTGTLAAMVNGKVNADDLANGLFAFGCTRDHAITPGAVGEQVEYQVSQYPEVHVQLVRSLLAAEADKRIFWRPNVKTPTTFDDVSALLEAHGYKPLMSDEEFVVQFPHRGSQYNYPAVEHRSTELEVVWDGHVRSETTQVAPAAIVFPRGSDNGDESRSESFRKAADFARLTAQDGPTVGEQSHLFDLNQGTIYACSEAAKVRGLVELARVHAPSSAYGEHHALLGLVARRVDLERFNDGRLLQLTWHRAYHVGALSDPEAFVSLADWLNEQGEVPNLDLTEAIGNVVVESIERIAERAS
jgi:hypothetical protein